MTFKSVSANSIASGLYHSQKNTNSKQLPDVISKLLNNNNSLEYVSHLIFKSCKKSEYYSSEFVCGSFADLKICNSNNGAILGNSF